MINPFHNQLMMITLIITYSVQSENNCFVCDQLQFLGNLVRTPCQVCDIKFSKCIIRQGQQKGLRYRGKSGGKLKKKKGILNY